MDKYQIDTEIGIGQFSQVFKGREKHTILHVAIKRVDKCMMNKIVNEVQVMHKLNHPYIMKFYDWYETKNNLWLIVEYCTGNNLKQLLDSDHHLPETSIQLFGIDMITALRYTHALGLVHCDIRPENFLIDECGSLKLCDFKYCHKICNNNSSCMGDYKCNNGSNSKSSSNTANNCNNNNNSCSTPMSKRGTIGYMCIELYTEVGGHTISSDIFALGCTLYQCRRGICPYGNMDKFIEYIGTGSNKYSSDNIDAIDNITPEGTLVTASTIDSLCEHLVSTKPPLSNYLSYLSTHDPIHTNATTGSNNSGNNFVTPVKHSNNNKIKGVSSSNNNKGNNSSNKQTLVQPPGSSSRGGSSTQPVQLVLPPLSVELADLLTGVLQPFAIYRYNWEHVLAHPFWYNRQQYQSTLHNRTSPSNILLEQLRKYSITTTMASNNNNAISCTLADEAAIPLSTLPSSSTASDAYTQLLKSKLIEECLEDRIKQYQQQKALLSSPQLQQQKPYQQALPSPLQHQHLLSPVPTSTNKSFNTEPATLSRATFKTSNNENNNIGGERTNMNISNDSVLQYLVNRMFKQYFIQLPSRSNSMIKSPFHSSCMTLPKELLIQSVFDLQVKPLVGNKTIELIEKYSDSINMNILSKYVPTEQCWCMASAIPVSTVQIDAQRIQNTQKTTLPIIEKHLSLIYRHLYKLSIVYVAPPPTTATNTAAISTSDIIKLQGYYQTQHHQQDLDRLNLLYYLQSICITGDIANFILNSQFLYIILRYIKGHCIMIVQQPSQQQGSGNSNQQLQQSSSSKAHSSYHQIKCYYSFTVRNIAMTTLATLLRYATLIHKPVHSQSMIGGGGSNNTANQQQSTQDHILPVLLSVIKELQSMHNNRMSALDSSSSKDILLLKRRCHAAIGEMLFYVSAQEENEASVDASNNKWLLPNGIITTLTKCLHEYVNQAYQLHFQLSAATSTSSSESILIDYENNIITLHYLIKSIENILAQGVIDVAQKFISIEIHSSLWKLCYFCVAIALGGNDDNCGWLYSNSNSDLMLDTAVKQRLCSSIVTLLTTSVTTIANMLHVIIQFPVVIKDRLSHQFAQHGIAIPPLPSTLSPSSSTTDSITNSTHIMAYFLHTLYQQPHNVTSTSNETPAVNSINILIQLIQLCMKNTKTTNATSSNNNVAIITTTYYQKILLGCVNIINLLLHSGNCEDNQVNTNHGLSSTRLTLIYALLQPSSQQHATTNKLNEMNTLNLNSHAIIYQLIYKYIINSASSVNTADPIMTILRYKCVVIVYQCLDCLHMYNDNNDSSNHLVLLHHTLERLSNTTTTPKYMQWFGKVCQSEVLFPLLFGTDSNVGGNSTDTTVPTNKKIHFLQHMVYSDSNSNTATVNIPRYVIEHVLNCNNNTSSPSILPPHQLYYHCTTMYIIQYHYNLFQTYLMRYQQLVKDNLGKFITTFQQQQNCNAPEQVRQLSSQFDIIQSIILTNTSYLLAPSQANYKSVCNQWCTLDGKHMGIIIDISTHVYQYFVMLQAQQPEQAHTSSVLLELCFHILHTFIYPLFEMIINTITSMDIINHDNNDNTMWTSMMVMTRLQQDGYHSDYVKQLLEPAKSAIIVSSKSNTSGQQHQQAVVDAIQMSLKYHYNDIACNVYHTHIVSGMLSLLSNFVMLAVTNKNSSSISGTIQHEMTLVLFNMIKRLLPYCIHLYSYMCSYISMNNNSSNNEDSVLAYIQQAITVIVQTQQPCLVLYNYSKSLMLLTGSNSDIDNGQHILQLTYNQIVKVLISIIDTNSNYKDVIYHHHFSPVHQQTSTVYNNYYTQWCDIVYNMITCTNRNSYNNNMHDGLCAILLAYDYCVLLQQHYTKQCNSDKSGNSAGSVFLRVNLSSSSSSAPSESVVELRLTCTGNNQQLHSKWYSCVSEYNDIASLLLHVMTVVKLKQHQSFKHGANSNNVLSSYSIFSVIYICSTIIQIIISTCITVVCINDSNSSSKMFDGYEISLHSSNTCYDNDNNGNVLTNVSNIITILMGLLSPSVVSGSDFNKIVGVLIDFQCYIVLLLQFSLQQYVRNYKNNHIGNNNNHILTNILQVLQMICVIMEYVVAVSNTRSSKKLNDEMTNIANKMLHLISYNTTVTPQQQSFIVDYAFSNYADKNVLDHLLSFIEALINDIAAQSSSSGGDNDNIPTRLQLYTDVLSSVIKLCSHISILVSSTRNSSHMIFYDKLLSIYQLLTSLSTTTMQQQKLQQDLITSPMIASQLMAWKECLDKIHQQ